MPITISCIVEGHGEVQAVPILLRRLVTELAPKLDIRLNPPLRVKRDRFISQDEEFHRYVELAARKSSPDGGILILLDAESSCPANLGPELLAKARKLRGDMPMAVILAKWEYEAWFLASAKSLRKVNGLPEDLQSPTNPETIRGAKEWLKARMSSGQYIEPLHQPSFTAQFDLRQARHAPSFDKCYRAVHQLLRDLQYQGPRR